MSHFEPFRILLVDTRVVYRQGVHALLQRFPELEVVGEAHDGDEALSQAQKLQPDVVLMDLHAPGYDVFQAISSIRSELPQLNILILALETDSPALALRAIREGARGFILHDTEIENMVAAICFVAQGQVVLAPQFLDEIVDSTSSLKRPDSSGSRIDGLTVRERQVLDLMTHGVSNRAIAEQLLVSESTIRTHMHNIFDKLDVSNRVQAISLLYRQDLLHF